MISFLILLLFGIGLLHAQQPDTEFWFSFGDNYNPIPNDPVVYGSNTCYEVHIASLHHAKGSYTSFIRETAHRDLWPTLLSGKQLPGLCR